jgi:hypothetical protein
MIHSQVQGRCGAADGERWGFSAGLRPWSSPDTLAELSANAATERRVSVWSRTSTSNANMGWSATILARGITIAVAGAGTFAIATYALNWL